MAPSTGVTRLKLTNFRSYTDLDLQIDTRPVCLFGSNGAGKTNLVEAVSFLGPGRGLRAAGTEAVRRKTDDGPSPVWAVFAEADTREGPVSLASGSDPGDPKRRRTKLEGAVTTQSQLARLFPMMWLTPREDRLWAGPRSDRLRFFDRLVLAGEPTHGEAATTYDKAMRQRQRLLDQMAEGVRPDPDWLKVLENEMAASGVATAASRLDALVRLQGEIDDRAETRFPKADLGLEGYVESLLAETGHAADAEDEFAAELERVRGRDSAVGRALTGPHRTELTARHRDKDQPAGDCSTGEQKSMVLGLSLAQASALGKLKGAPPVLIFDEACAHLDAARRDGLIEAILEIGAQAWLTGVERILFEAFGGAGQFIRVGDGGAELV